MILLGTDLLVYQTINGTTSAIAAARNCEISISTDMIETTSPSSGAWTTFRTGRKDWSVGVSGLVSVTDGASDLQAILQSSGNQVTLTFKMKTDRYGGSGNVDVCSGSAICKSVKVGAGRGNLSTWSCDFRGNGELSFE